MRKKFFEYGIDFIYLVGGLVIFGIGAYFAYFGIGLDIDGDALVERILLSTSFIVSGFFYLRYAFHLNYPNRYIRYSLLSMLCSVFPFFKFTSVPFNSQDIQTYILSIASIFAVFIFFLVFGLVFLFIGYMKGRTNLEDVNSYPVKN